MSKRNKPEASRLPTTEPLLTRADFKAQVLNRNNGRCVIPTCTQPAVDAHHILNRNLYTHPTQQGGYYLTNGAGLCPPHHLDSEQTLINPHTLYEYCNTPNPTLPLDMNPHLNYDTWGNTINQDGSRTPGPLYHSTGCQKALKASNNHWRFWNQ